MRDHTSYFGRSIAVYDKEDIKSGTPINNAFVMLGGLRLSNPLSPTNPSPISVKAGLSLEFRGWDSVADFEAGSPDDPAYRERFELTKADWTAFNAQYPDFASNLIAAATAFLEDVPGQFPEYHIEHINISIVDLRMHVQARHKTRDEHLHRSTRGEAEFIEVQTAYPERQAEILTVAWQYGADNSIFLKTVQPMA